MNLDKDAVSLSNKMTNRFYESSLSFVFQPAQYEEVQQNHKVCGACIVDCSCEEIEIANTVICLIETDIKLSWRQLVAQENREALRSCRSKRIWVEFFNDFTPNGFGLITETIKSFKDCRFHLITGDIKLIHHLFENPLENCSIAIKGSEAFGFVGSETTLGLVSYVEKLSRDHNCRQSIAVWGGVGTPEGAASLLDSGIDTIVFEGAHLQTESFLTRFPIAEKFRSVRIDHSTLVEIVPGLLVRTYSKGKSNLAKKLISQADEEGKVLFSLIDQLQGTGTCPIHSSLAPEELIFCGVELSFCSSFVNQFGSDTFPAIKGFRQKVSSIVNNVDDICERFFGSAGLSIEFGIEYPFIQGAMACISDTVEFAKTVAEAGGLPTIAFGMQSLDLIEKKYSGLQDDMGHYSYAINVIALSENPFLEDQLSWIIEHPPTYVVVSAGQPSFAEKLQEKGIKTIFVTSDIELLKLAWKKNISHVVLEGSEAGGHVGELSTFSLAQAVQDIRRGDEVSPGRVILAGGFFDSSSVRRGAILGGDGVQMGTVYLATTEVVATKSCAKLYQDLIINSSVGSTLLTGTLTGLRVRSLHTPKIESLRELEKELTHSKTDLSAIRESIERESGGSLYKAARGYDIATSTKLTDEQCYESGQFMSGSVAGLIANVASVTVLHKELRTKPSNPLRNGGNNKSEVQSMALKEKVAITGMAAVNCLGNDPESVWTASKEMRCGLTKVPPARWDHTKYYSSSGELGKTYCNVGGFISLSISRQDLQVSPHDFRTMTDSTKLTLWLAKKAIQDSNILSSSIPRDRIGVLVSQNSGETGSTIEDLTLSVIAPNLAETIQQELNLDSSLRNDITDILTRNRISVDDTTLLGRLNCTAGGFVCNTYGFTGPSYSVSAACATGLVALYTAVSMIKNGILDAAIIGGGEELLHPASYLEFSALGALASRINDDFAPHQASRPFDKKRDGMVLGEGGGMIVIERESLAVERDAKIYAMITGVGASNNHKGMVESVAETQKLAIDASFVDSGYSPETVDLVECHATATPTGDIEEIKALKEVFPNSSGTQKQLYLSSFKSQIGHTLGASGLNSLIRGICAMREGFFPPTINYDTVDPDLDLESWGFKVCTTPEKWISDGDRPRRFQVNAFGFGGANYVVQIEESPGVTSEPVSPTQGFSKKLLSDIGLTLFYADNGSTQFRVASEITKSSEVERYLGSLTELSTELPRIKRQELDRAGITIGKPDPYPLAFIFAGQGTHYQCMGKELYDVFPTIRFWMDKIAALADYDLLGMLFSDKESDLRKTQWQQPALFILEYSIYKQLEEYGITPKALAGHSMGELTALTVAGCFSYEDGFNIISKRARCMEKASKIADDPGSMIAVDAPSDVLEAIVEKTENLFYTNYNSPHQVVIGGGTKEIDDLKKKLDDLKHWSHILPVSMAFHSPLMQIIRDDLGNYLDVIDFKPPVIPVISNTTKHVYPADSEEIKRILLAHLESPVYWQSNVETLWNDFSIRHFVEIGPRDTLSKMVRDIVPDAVSWISCYPEKESRTLQRTFAELWVNGHLSCSDTPIKLFTGDPVGGPKPLSVKQGQRDKNRIRELVQQEINLFALDGVERYLKPAIVEKINKELDPSFTRSDLATFFPFDDHAGGGKIIPTLPEPAHDAKPVINNIRQGGHDGNDEILELVIEIIMDATGYERDELAPEMDIRQDLSIRSSRLPIIMDAAENQFGIVIKLEDFMDVRTIGDFAERVQKVSSSQGSEIDVQADKPKAKLQQDGQGQVIPIDEQRSSYRPVRRYCYSKKEFERVDISPLQIEKDARIVIVSFAGESACREVCTEIEKNIGGAAELFTISNEREQEPNIYDPEELQTSLQVKMQETSPTGIIVVSDGEYFQNVGLLDIESCCQSVFGILQLFLKSASKTFCVHLELEKVENSFHDVFCEGILGLFLAGQIEYQSVLFRTIASGLQNIGKHLQIAIDTSIKPVSIECDREKVYTPVLQSQPLPVKKEQQLSLGADDVIVITGGCRGITAYISKVVGRFGCTLVLLGRTGAAGNDEIQETLTIFAESGQTVEYLSCDVSDQQQVNRTIESIKDKYGRVDGLIHGAGVLSDSFLQLLTFDDFAQVLNVKFSGLIHLVQSCGESLRFVSCLSSLAAATGNIGQANYCCGNRLMAAYLSCLQQQGAIQNAKSFWLPPVEGAGMAEDADLKDLIKVRLGEDVFVAAHEIGELVVQELVSGPISDMAVFPVRKLPSVATVTIKSSDADVEGWFRCDNLPMIDKIVEVDKGNRFLRAERSFSHEHDLWLQDHIPFQWLKHPILSAVMILESFVELGGLYFSSLSTYRLEKVAFEKMFECPLGEITRAEVVCRLKQITKKQTICDLVFGKPGLVNGDSDIASEFVSFFTGYLCLTDAPPSRDFDRDLKDSEVLEPLMGKEAIKQYYKERSGLVGRYQVLETIAHCDESRITGTMLYPECKDFSSDNGVLYYYPLYLLEALMQCGAFQYGIVNRESEKITVPAAIESLEWYSQCTQGEKILLEVECIETQENYLVFNGKGYSEASGLIMEVAGLRMNLVA